MPIQNIKVALFSQSISQLNEEIQAVAQMIRRTEAQVLTVMLGSNDLLQRPSLRVEIVEGRMEQFLAALLAAAPSNLQVLLIAHPPMKLGA